LAHPVRQYRLLMSTNTGSVSKTKRSLIYRMGQKMKLQTLVHIFTKIDGFTDLYCGAMVVCLVITLLQIFRRICEWKKIENRSI